MTTICRSIRARAPVHRRRHGPGARAGTGRCSLPSKPRRASTSVPPTCARSSRPSWARRSSARARRPRPPPPTSCSSPSTRTRSGCRSARAPRRSCRGPSRRPRTDRAGFARSRGSLATWFAIRSGRSWHPGHRHLGRPDASAAQSSAVAETRPPTQPPAMPVIPHRRPVTPVRRRSSRPAHLRRTGSSHALVDHRERRSRGDHMTGNLGLLARRELSHRRCSTNRRLGARCSALGSTGPGVDWNQHYFGAAAFIGSGWQRRWLFLEANLGLGVELVRAAEQDGKLCHNSPQARTVDRDEGVGSNRIPRSSGGWRGRRACRCRGIWIWSHALALTFDRLAGRDPSSARRSASGCGCRERALSHAPAGRARTDSACGRRGRRRDRRGPARRAARRAGGGVRLLARRVRVLARRLLSDPASAEDVVQEVFACLVRAMRRFRGEVDVETFILAIAVKRARHHQRTAARRRRAMSGSRGRIASAARIPSRTPIGVSWVSGWRRRSTACRSRSARRSCCARWRS